MRRLVPSSLLLFTTLAGCAVEPALDGPTLATSRAAVVVDNGTSLNGTSLNGTSLNGTSLNGDQLSGVLASVAYASARREGIDGGKLDHLELRGTVFHGTKGSSTFSGLDFNDARFVGTLGNGERRELRVDRITPGSGAAADVWTYRVSFLHTDGRWYPVCRDASGAALDALPVAGRWDYRFGTPGVGGAKIDDPAAFTFACEGGAVAKCVRLGYRPWVSPTLAAHHQACTRLIRADFCGDGTAHTLEGQRVNLYDAIGVQHDDQDSWVPEAEWDAKGARCFYALNRSHAAVPCYNDRVTLGCGAPSNFQAGALLMSETPSNGVLPEEP